MVDITHKIYTLRKAVASARVDLSLTGTMDAIVGQKVPKGDVLEFARVAGLLAIKKTSDLIPDCHPIPIEYAAITFRMEGLAIFIKVEVHTVYKTGVEVEAMHGASLAALTLYDMLKPIDKGIEINSIRLESKQGGKTNYFDSPITGLTCAVVVCSDTISGGTKKDFAGQSVIRLLEQNKLNCSYYKVIADEISMIQAEALELSRLAFSLILFVGGTGLSPRDVTPEAIAPLLDRSIPGIMEAARAYGQDRTPYAMLSRGVAGFIDRSLVLTLPGSTKGAEETMMALFPYLLHVFTVAQGLRHPGVDR